MKDFFKSIQFIGGWEPGANEKNIYEFGFHSSPLCSLDTDAPGCTLGRPGTWLESENMETWRILQLLPAYTPLPSELSSLTKDNRGVLGHLHSPLLLNLETFPASIFQPLSLFLALQNMKSSFWPIPSPK